MKREGETVLREPFEGRGGEKRRRPLLGRFQSEQAQYIGWVWCKNLMYSADPGSYLTMPPNGVLRCAPRTLREAMLIVQTRF